MRALGRNWSNFAPYIIYSSITNRGHHLQLQQHHCCTTPTSTPSSLVSSTCGTNCHQTQWGLHRPICSRTDSPPSCCVKPLYWTMFYQHFTMHCFYQFLLMSSTFTRILSLAHLFYAYVTHGPNKSASAQYDNTRGAWLTQEGCTLTERKEGRTSRLLI